MSGCKYVCGKQVLGVPWVLLCPINTKFIAMSLLHILKKLN